MKLWIAILPMLLAAPAGAESLFPQGPPPAKVLDVVDLEHEPIDTRLALTTLQGIVNRGDTTRLYVRMRKTDDLWLKTLEDKGYIEGHSILTVEECLAKYGDRCPRAVVYDPQVSATLNVATMMAALDPAMVVAPADADRFAAGKPREDLAGRWATNADAYRWAFRELWPRMSRKVLACYHPTGTHHFLRDYLVQAQVFTFWVTSEESQDGTVSDHEKEKALLLEILEQTPVNIPVIGFWYGGADRGMDEYRGVGLAGEYGKLTVVNDWSPNLSVLSGVRADLPGAVRKYRERLGQRRPPAFDPGKVYIGYDIVESGDAPVYLHGVQPLVWEDPRRGEIPINWSMGPSAVDLMSPIVEYYFDQATPADYIYVSLSGVAYTHPYRDFLAKTPDPQAAWTRYLALTADYMARIGAREISLYTDSWKPFDRHEKDPVTRRFVDGVPGLDMLVMGMGRDEGRTALNGNYLMGDPPVVVSHILTRWPTDFGQKTKEENIAWLVDDIRAHTPAERPAFMQVMALSWAYYPADILKVHQALGPDYVPVTLAEFSQLFRAHGSSAAEAPAEEVSE